MYTFDVIEVIELHKLSNIECWSFLKPHYYCVSGSWYFISRLKLSFTSQPSNLYWSCCCTFKTVCLMLLGVGAWTLIQIWGEALSATSLPSGARTFRGSLFIIISQMRHDLASEYLWNLFDIIFHQWFIDLYLP